MSVSNTVFFNGADGSLTCNKAYVSGLNVSGNSSQPGGAQFPALLSPTMGFGNLYQYVYVSPGVMVTNQILPVVLDSGGKGRIATDIIVSGNVTAANVIGGSTYTLPSNLVVQQLNSNIVISNSSSFNSLQSNSANIATLTVSNLQGYTPPATNTYSLTGNSISYLYASLGNANISNLTYSNATASNLACNNATITNLSYLNANASNLVCNNASIQNLTGNNANLVNLRYSNALGATANLSSIYTSSVQGLAPNTLTISGNASSFTYGNVGSLTAQTANVSTLFVSNAVVGNAMQYATGNIGNLVSNNITVGTLYASNIVGYSPPAANTQTLTGNSLTYLNANIGNLISNNITVSTLYASNIVGYAPPAANTQTLTGNTLVYNTANLANLQSNVANISTLFVANLVGYSAPVQNLYSISGNASSYLYSNTGTLTAQTANVGNLSSTTETTSVLIANNARVLQQFTGNVCNVVSLAASTLFCSNLVGYTPPQTSFTDIVGNSVTYSFLKGNVSNVGSLAAQVIYCSNVVGLSIPQQQSSNLYAISGNSANYTYLTTSNLAVVGSNTATFGGNVTANNFTTPGTLAFTTLNPGDMAARLYATADRYGMGQYQNGATRLFTSSTFNGATVNLSLASTDGPSGNSSLWTDLLTASQSSVLINRPLTVTNNATVTGFTSLGNAVTDTSIGQTAAIVNRVGNISYAFPPQPSQITCSANYTTPYYILTDYNYPNQVGNVPGGRLQMNDSNFSADWRWQTKVPGVATNPLVERLTVTGYGNVGVNQPAPQATFDVSGQGRITGNLAVGGLTGPVTVYGPSNATNFLQGSAAQSLIVGNALGTNQSGFFNYNAVNSAPGAAGSVGIGVYGVSSGITVSPTGNVGINQIAPQFINHVQPNNTDVQAINPDAVNSVMVYEDCRGTTLSSGYLTGVATYSQANGYIQLTPQQNTTDGTLNYPINPGTAFDVTAETYVGTSGSTYADGLAFYCYGSAPVTFNGVGFGAGTGYALLFDDYAMTSNSNFAYTVALYWNGTLLASQTPANYQIPLNAWNQLRVSFVRNVWKVWLGGTMVINYQDVSRSLVGAGTNNMGFTAHCGGLNAYHWVRNIQVSKHCQGPWRPQTIGNVPGIQYNGPVAVNGAQTISSNLAVYGQQLLLQSGNVTPLQLVSTGGGAGNPIGMGLGTFVGRPTPPAIVSAIDDGSFSAHLLLSTATSGSSTNVAQERVRVTPGGLVGINQNNPQYPLDVYGVLRAQMNNVSQTYINSGGSYTISAGSALTNSSIWAPITFGNQNSTDITSALWATNATFFTVPVNGLYHLSFDGTASASNTFAGYWTFNKLGGSSTNASNLKLGPSTCTTNLYLHSNFTMYLQSGDQPQFVFASGSTGSFGTNGASVRIVLLNRM